MQFIPFPKSLNINSEILLRINTAAYNLKQKLILLDISSLSISAYNKRYLKSYIEEVDFYIPIYAQLMAKAIGELRQPIELSGFVDYGGGCGILSFLAKEIGFEKVIYNDIYDVSVADSKTIGNALGIKIDYSICGDISDLHSFLNSSKIRIDLICSMDVLEHIYNVDNWFCKANELEGNFSVVFLTSANSQNPFVRRRLKKMQNIAEYLGRQKTEGWKERDIEKPFLQLRYDIIKEVAPELEQSKIEFLAKSTRGLMIDDIKTSVTEYLHTGNIEYKMLHPTNTCDPYTGNWTENLIDLNYLRNAVSKKGFEVEITNSFYSYSKSKLVNILKGLLNFIMFVFGKKVLLISPSYTLVARKNG